MKNKIIPTTLSFFLIIILASISLFSSTEKHYKTHAYPTFYSNQNGSDLTSLLKNALLDAKESIYISIFSLTDHGIIRTLNSQAEKGIDITIHYDAKNSFGLKKKLHPSVKCCPKKITSGLMHKKILILDKSDVWLGSTNLTYSSLRMHGNLMMHAYSKELAKAIIEEDKEQKLYFIQDQPLELWLLPHPNGKNRIIELLDQAKNSIQIAMFTWTDPLLTEAVLDAAKRGVNVEVILDRNASLGTSKKIASLLSSNIGYFAVSKTDALLHYKFAYIDRQTLIHGSTNWTRAAFKSNEECHLILENMREEQIEFMNTLWDHLKEASEEALEEVA